MTMDKRYDYPSIVAVKIVVKQDDTVLLIREPETNEWMPGRLNLPGGKLFLNESILEALERKIKTEVGLEVETKGLIKIVDILMPEKNVFHLVFLAEYRNGEIGDTETESSDIAWYNKDDIAKFDINDYGEYYIAQILREVFDGKLQLIPPNSIKVQDNRQKDIMEWMQKDNTK